MDNVEIAHILNEYAALLEIQGESPFRVRAYHGEIQAAQHGTVPELITGRDIHGNLHMHSTWTDGANSIEEMVQACQELGYEYCAYGDRTSWRQTGARSIGDREGLSTGFSFPAPLPPAAAQEKMRSDANRLALLSLISDPAAVVVRLDCAPG